MTIRVCNTCHTHLVNTTACPECTHRKNPSSVGRALMIGALLGLGLTGCGDKEEDTAEAEDTTDTEGVDQALYGVAETEE